MQNVLLFFVRYVKCYELIYCCYFEFETFVCILVDIMTEVANHPKKINIADLEIGAPDA